MSDNAVQVKLEASYGQFQSAFEKARAVVADACQGMREELKAMSDDAKVDSKNYESSVEQFGNIVQNRFKGINGAIAGVKTMWAQLGVVIGAGLAAGKAVDDASKYTTEIQKLARGLGITSNSASGLALALGDVHSTSDDFLKLSKGLDATLRKNEKAMNDMGLVTRDANGDFRNQKDLVVDAIQVLNQYKEGTDRNLAAQTMFGQGVQANAEIMALSSKGIEEAQKKAEALNMVVGTESVEANAAYRQAIGDANDVMEAMKLAVGNALMPVLTDLANWFAEIGPTAVLAIRASIAILISLFRGLAFMVKAVYEIVAASFESMADYASVFGEVLSNVLSGNWGEAQAAAAKFSENMKANFGQAFDNISADARATSDAIVGSFSGLVKPASEGSAEGGGKDYVDTAAADKRAAAAERARKAELAAQKRAAAEAHRIELDAYQAKMELLKGEEQAVRGHWDALKAIQLKELEITVKMYGETSKEAEAVRNKIKATERAALDEFEKIQELKVQAAQNAAMARIDAEQQAAQFEVQLGLRTLEEMLRAEEEFENQRFELKRQMLEAEALLLADKPIQQQQVFNELELLEQQHMERIIEIRNQAQLEASKPMETMFRSMETSFASAITGMLTRTMTLRQGLASIFKSIFATFVQEMIAKPLAQWAIRVVRELLMHKSLAASKNVIDKAASVSGVVKAAGLAGANGVASFAAAPWPVNIGAPAFGAAMAAAAMAFGATAAAEEGYDIPAGVNPITQLHQREMVLPSAQADVIRGLADGGGAASSGDVHIHLNAADGDSVKRMLMNNKPALVAAIKQAKRDGMKLD